MNRILSIALLSLVAISAGAADRFAPDPEQISMATTARIVRIDFKSKTIKVKNVFTLKRTGGLSTDDFLANAGGYYFAADLTDGQNTGAQGWKDPTKTPPTGVPEPLTISLLGAGLGAVAFSRKKKKKA